ncbi:MAG: uL30 family ribosomal protein [Candidatus Nanoarchaeia archaeon]|nr:uL30 family ribosomal protein [Candidatus Nanoarchaeia archaeon]
MTNLLIRIRGTVGLTKEVKDTFLMLRLIRSHWATLLPESPVYDGMIKKLKDFSIFGKISDKMLEELLEKRLKTKNNKPVTKELIKKVMDTLKSGKLLKDVEEVHPILRLAPPVKGFKGGVKKTVKQGGVLGKHESIDMIAKKMM